MYICKALKQKIMERFIRETYNLPERPEAWGSALKEAVKQFYLANGVLPNCICLHKENYKLFPKVVELSGFTIISTSIGKAVEKNLEYKKELENLLALEITFVVSPKNDYRLFCMESNEVTQRQFQLGNIDGAKQSVN
jgi:hypothetical protein